MDLNIERMKDYMPMHVLVERYVKLRRSGKNMIGLCPFHSEKTGSFHVETGKNFAKCFGCGWAGDQIDFLESIESLDKKDAINRFKELTGTSKLPDDWKKVKQVFKPLDGKKEQFKGRWNEADWTLTAGARLLSDHGIPGMTYLLKRGISKETAEHFNLGYWDSGEKFFPNSIPEDQKACVESPWVGIPYSENKKITMIKMRAVNSDVEPRYRAVKGSVIDRLYNMSTIDPTETVYVTEGEFDAIVIEQAGFRAVALPSAQYRLTPEDKDALLMADKIILAGDNDDGIGVAAMNRLMNDLGDKAHVLMWPKGEGQKKVDASSFFCDSCNFDVGEFRKRLLVMTADACAPKSAHFDSLQTILERLKSGQRPEEDPNRLRFPWEDVDKMTLVIPGDIVVVGASYTGTGKSTFTTQFCMHNALNFGKTIVVYTPDMKPERHSRLIASQIMSKSRIDLTPEDYQLAIDTVSESSGKVYLGFDPDAKNAEQAIDICEQAVKRLGADVLVLDHIHYIARNTKYPVQAIENAMKRLNDFSEKMGIITVVVTQSRKTAPTPGQQDRVAQLDDIKYAEAITSDAATVLLVHRKRMPTPNFSIGSHEELEQDVLDPMTYVRAAKGREQLGGKQAAWLRLEGGSGKFMSVVEDGVPIW